MIDWKAKLTSRKFWIAVCTLVSQLVLAFRGTEEAAVQITGIIMASATVIAYIIGEGLADSSPTVYEQHYHYGEGYDNEIQ